MKKLLLLFAIVVVAASARAADSVCEELDKAVESGVKEMAFYDDAALGTPATDVISRKLNLVAEASKIQSNLVLMQANKCPMPKQPINPRVYFHSALACVHTIQRSATDQIPECDRKTWKRVDEK